MAKVLSDNECMAKQAKYMYIKAGAFNRAVTGTTYFPTDVMDELQSLKYL